MIEVNVGHDEQAVLVQELRYLGKLLRLELSDIFEYALSEYDIELLSSNRMGASRKSASIRFGAGCWIAMSMP